MKRFRVRRIPGPLNRSNHGLWLPLQLLDERREPFRLFRIDFLCQQGRGRKIWIEVSIDERAHYGGQDQRGEEILIEMVPTDDVQGIDGYGVVGSAHTLGNG